MVAADKAASSKVAEATVVFEDALAASAAKTKKERTEEASNKIKTQFGMSAMTIGQAVVAAQAEETYPGYGYEPTPGQHLGEKEYSPYLDIGYPQHVFWGDTHLHTSLSTDAGMIGNRLGPAEAFRFAKGETVTSSMGIKARLKRPLDWSRGRATKYRSSMTNITMYFEGFIGETGVYANKSTCTNGYKS